MARLRNLTFNQIVMNDRSYCYEQYLCEIDKIPLITVEEEVELSILIKEGNEEALQKLVVSNLRFVVSVAKRYQGQGLSLIDMINEGNLGLIKAAWLFDHTRGFKFISYAVWWIRQSILSAIANNSMIIRQPSNRVTLNEKIKKQIKVLQQEFHREPTNEELSFELGVTEEYVLEIKNSFQDYGSLDALFDNESENERNLLHVLPCKDNNPEESFIAEATKDKLWLLLQELPKRDLMIMIFLFGLGEHVKPLTILDTARIMGINQNTVRRAKRKTLVFLRKKFEFLDLEMVS